MKIPTYLMTLFTILFIIGSIWLFQYSIKYGIIGMVLAAIVIGSFLAWRSRETIGFVMRTIETQMFGKPLDKEYWNDGEKAKLPKFVWRKKDGKD